MARLIRINHLILIRRIRFNTQNLVGRHRLGFSVGVCASLILFTAISLFAFSGMTSKGKSDVQFFESLSNTTGVSNIFVAASELEVNFVTSFESYSFLGMYTTLTFQ